MKERNLRILLIFLLLISVLINISYYMEDKHAVSQKDGIVNKTWSLLHLSVIT